MKDAALSVSTPSSVTGIDWTLKCRAVATMRRVPHERNWKPSGML